MSLVGWVIALIAIVLVLRARSRQELVACSSHELRGAATALELAQGAGPAATRLGLDRLRAGLDDLDAARHGRRAEAVGRAIGVEALLHSAALGWRSATSRPVRVRWEGPPAQLEGDPGRVAQALGNLFDNAIEHGEGDIELTARRAEDGGVRLELADDGIWVHRVPIRRPGRGRGLRIAARAVRDSGGRLEVGTERSSVAIELPAVRS